MKLMEQQAIEPSSTNCHILGQYGNDRIDQQIKKSLREIASMELELARKKQLLDIITKSDPNREIRTELEKQKLIMENIVLKAKIANMEQEDQLKQNKQNGKEDEQQGEYAFVEQFAQLQNVQQTLSDRISQLENQLKKQQQQQKDNQHGEYVSAGQFEAIQERMGQLEKQLNQQQIDNPHGKYVSAGQFEAIQERMGRLEKQVNQQQEEKERYADRLLQQNAHQQTDFCTKISELSENFRQLKEMHDDFETKIDEKLNANAEFANSIQTKCSKLEEQQNKLKNSVDILNYRVGNALIDQILELQNEQKEILGRMSEIEKKQQKDEEKETEKYGEHHAILERIGMISDHLLQTQNQQMKICAEIDAVETNSYELYGKICIDHFEPILARIGQLEKGQQDQNAHFDQLNTSEMNQSEKLAKMENEIAEHLSKLRNDHAQQQKEFCSKIDEMLQRKADAEKENDKLKNDHKEMEEKMDKLEDQLGRKLDAQKAFQEELEKKVTERIVTVQTKVDKMEMAHQQQKVVTEKAIFERIGELEGQQKHQKQQGEKETNAFEERFSQLHNEQKKLEKEQKQLQKENIVSEDHLKVILERIGELEKQQQQQTKAFLQSQNDQKKILEKISETEKQRKKKVFLKFQENFWDSFACHKDIEIIGDKSLIVHHKGNTSGWRSVFAKYPIVLNKHLSDFFYYEISVMEKEKRWCITFGFTVKQQTKKGTYAYACDGDIWINGQEKGTNAKHSYGVGDTVGIGVHLASRQMIFTKNGLRLDSSGLLVDPSFADGSLYPFVTLSFSGDKIEANFGPNFKFDLATL